MALLRASNKGQNQSLIWKSTCSMWKTQSGLWFRADFGRVAGDMPERLNLVHLSIKVQLVH